MSLLSPARSRATIENCSPPSNPPFFHPHECTNHSETEAILTLCLIAFFADGEKHERERQQLKKIIDSLSGGEVDTTALYRDVLLNKPDVAAVAARLLTPGARQLA